MNWIEQHKALLITALITGIITFSMFSIHLTQAIEVEAETYIDLSKIETIVSQQEDQFLKSENRSDKAYNEDEAYEDLMKQFKSVPADDFENTMKALEETSKPIEPYSPKTVAPNNSNDYALNDEDRKTFNSIKDLLDNHNMAEHAKSASNFSYSLKDRQILYYDTPRYLCEVGGKVIVNVLVNSNGTVTEAYINKATTTTNACLLNSALDYAKEVLFSTSQSTEQLGSVTYYFKPKLGQ